MGTFCLDLAECVEVCCVDKRKESTSDTCKGLEYVQKRNQTFEVGGGGALILICSQSASDLGRTGPGKVRKGRHSSEPSHGTFACLPGPSSFCLLEARAQKVLV